ncbi:MAG TPA: aspartate kinase, partial [Myxococcaceae bacterium]|nr:aspartate kinase [Myxococcaceae bacterium]
DRLLKLVDGISKFPDEREVDVLLSTGEQVTSALLAITFKELGYDAVSLQGSQVRIMTDSAYGKARISEVEGEKVLAALKAGKIVVIPGFQGVDEEGNITTLGRGGSDTTAVAIAAALKADLCEIYTDVDGVYTADPNVCPAARKLDRIAYEEMLELASLGAKVLQIRSVEFAMKYRVPLWVKSSFVEDPGTLVCAEDAAMEQVVVSGIAHDRNEARLTLREVPDRPGVAARIFGALAEHHVVVDIIVQTAARSGRSDLSFTVTKADFATAREAMAEVAAELGIAAVESDDRIAKVSIVGLGMRNHAGVAAKMFQVLAAEGVNIQMISTSEIKVSCVVDEKCTELAVRSLHSAFGLDASASTEVRA